MNYKLRFFIFIFFILKIIEVKMKKRLIVFIVLSGIITVINRFPCHWVNPKRCTIHELPKEESSYIIRYNASKLSFKV